MRRATRRHRRRLAAAGRCRGGRGGGWACDAAADGDAAADEGAGDPDGAALAEPEGAGLPEAAGDPLGAGVVVGPSMSPSGTVRITT